MSYHPKPKIRLSDQPQTLAERVIAEDILDLYVQNIPNDLTREGLTNIFVSAGPIESVKIIPSKIPDSQTTFGFVRFKSKTSAMKAVQMFNNHKIGSQNLKVKFAKQVHGDGGGGGGGDFSKSRNSIIADEEFDWDEKKNSTNTSNGSKHRLDCESVFSQASSGGNTTKMVKKSMGRGQIINLIQEKHDLDPNRPYARRLIESRSRSSLNKGSESSSTVHLNVSNKSDQQKSKQLQHLKIGENYSVEITCALNPSYFYIQTCTSLKEIANLINNMHNCYQNEDEFNEVKDLKVGDYCACLVDDNWFRGKITAVDGQKYIVRLLDFGDTYELAHDDVNLLKPEFCENQFHGAIRCSLAGIRPYKSNDWAPQSIELLKNFLHNGTSHKAGLTAKIIDYDRNNDNTCLVHLYINDGNESVVDYLLSENLAEVHKPNDVKINNDDSPINKYSKVASKLLSYKSSSDCSTIAATTNIGDDEDEEDNFRLAQNLTSVSQRNSTFSLNQQQQFENLKNKNYQEKTCTLNNSMSNSIQRTRLFNSTFQVIKWKHFRTVPSFTCSPILLEVKVTTVFNSMNFFIQKENDVPTINNLLDSLQRYANVLLGDDEIDSELNNYMMNTTKFDLVLAKSKLDQKWRRALVLEKYEASEFFESNSELDNGQKMENLGYFLILFIDYGTEELIQYTKMLESFGERLLDSLVILPAHPDLITRPAYALKCLLSKTHIRKNALENKTNLNYEEDFEIEFRKTFKNPENKEMKLFMKIVQVENVKNETEAIIELLKIDKNMNKLNIIDYIDNKLKFVKLKIDDEKLTTVEPDDVNKRIMNKSEKEEILNAKTPDKRLSYIQPDDKSLKQNVQPAAVKNKSKQGINALKYVALMEVGEKYEATVVYVSDQTKLFLVENSQLSQIIEIQEHINSEEFLLKSTADVNEVKLNNTDLVVVLYELDETWYRAIVIDNIITEDNRIKLFFVDFGNEEYIKLDNIRRVTSNEDEKFHQTFKVNNCDLNLADSLTTDNKYVIEQLKKLEGTNVIIKILNLGKLSLSPKLSVENYLRNYVVTLYMDQKDETNNEQRLLKLLSSQKPQKPILPQKVSQYELSQFADADEKLKTSQPSRYTKLNKNKIYKVNFQYYDQSSNSIYFYLNENFEKLNQLQSYLQDAIENGFDYINSVKDIDTNEQYEALFKEDFKWYRCIVTKIEKSSIQVYFVDYGNLENLDLHEIKLSDYLRKRRVKKNEDIYKIDYQAIKGKYLKTFEEFAEEIPTYIQETNDNDSFFIKCIDSKENEFKFELIKHENENDKEVSDILESSFRQQQQQVESVEKESDTFDFELKCGEVYNCKYIVVDSAEEFYLHLIDNSAQTETMEKYLTELTEKQSGLFEKFTTRPFKNEIVLAKFEGIWSRAKIIEVKSKSQIKVFFIDYGNCDENSNVENILKINKIKNDILDLPPLSYCVRLNKIKIDLEKHQEIFAQMLANETILVKCMSIDKNDDKTVYNVEINDSNNKICYNKLFGSVEEEEEEEEEESTAIDQPNVVVDGSKILNAQYCCFDDIEKPIYLITSENIEKCNTLSRDLNLYYVKSSSSDNIKDENDLKIGEYYAIKHEDGNWYRAKLLAINKEKKLMNCRLIDFGFFEDSIKYMNKDEYLIKKLNKMFRKQPRQVFRGFLIDQTESNKLEFKNVEKIKDHIGEYFFENIDEGKKKDVKVRVILNFGKDEDDCDFVYAIEILNQKNESLNKLIHLENEALKKPVLVDKFHKINAKQLLKQKFDSTKMYHLFVKRVDCFYAFDENEVKKIQEDVVDTCGNILNLNNEFNFKSNAKALPEIGNMIFANFEEFVYRCEIKNFDENFENFELFFIDFGNTEIVSRSDIILPFHEKHVECFTKYPPQAYKSKLYGLKDTDTNREPFKNLVVEKIFKIKLIKKCIDANENSTHEVQLFHQDSKIDVHSYLIEMNHAKFDTLEVILNSIKTNEEIEFYTEQFKMLKLKLKL